MSDYLALDVGGSGIKYAVADEHYQLRQKGFLANTFTGHAEFVEAIGSVWDASGPELAGIAISTAGELDPATGEMFSGGHLRFNAGTNLIESLTARCRTRVTVENDANCALLAELHDGALTGCRNAAVFVIGTGVGGALLIDGRLHYGSHFHAGNASFTLVDLNRPDPGQLFALGAGVAGLTRPYAEALGVEPDTVDGRRFFEAFTADDPDALRILDAYALRLAGFIYNVHVLLDLDAVAIGGGISAQPSLVPAVDAHLQDLFDRSLVPLPRLALRVCRHRNDANLLGALRHHLAGG